MLGSGDSVSDRDSKSPSETTAWESLGFSKAYVQERQSVRNKCASLGIEGRLFVDPPSDLLGRTIAACVEVVPTVSAPAAQGIAKGSGLGWAPSIARVAALGVCILAISALHPLRSALERLESKDSARDLMLARLLNDQEDQSALLAKLSDKLESVSVSSPATSVVPTWDLRAINDDIREQSMQMTQLVQKFESIDARYREELGEIRSEISRTSSPVSTDAATTETLRAIAMDLDSQAELTNDLTRRVDAIGRWVQMMHETQQRQDVILNELLGRTGRAGRAPTVSVGAPETWESDSGANH